MFIDYVTLLLVNMAAGLAMAAAFVARGWDSPHRRSYGVGFLIVGLVAAIFGGHMAMFWPLPDSYNISHGEMSVLLGSSFLAAAIALLWGLSLVGAAWYMLFAGLVAILMGCRILHMGLTSSPLISGLGFILSGLGAVLILPMVGAKAPKPFRHIVAVVLAVSAVIWAFTAGMGYWWHMSGFTGYRPVVYQERSEAPGGAREGALENAGDSPGSTDDGPAGGDAAP